MAEVLLSLLKARAIDVHVETAIRKAIQLNTRTRGFKQDKIYFRR
jgi:hypothetical protein